MTSDKSYALEARLNTLIASVGGGPAALTALAARVTALEGGAGWLDNSPPVYDSWQDTAGLNNGWGKGSGYWKFVHPLPRYVLTIFDGLTVGTDTDGLTILTSANGFPTGYRPPTTITIPARTDALRTGVNGLESAGLVVQTDGSVTCVGFAGAASVASGIGLFPTSWF